MSTAAMIVHRHRCDQCSYSARQRSTLQRHVRCMHTPAEQIDWLHCDHCDYRTKLRSHLSKHVQRRHGGDTQLTAAAGTQPASMVCVPDVFQQVVPLEKDTVSTVVGTEPAANKQELHAFDRCEYVTHYESRLRQHKTVRHALPVEESRFRGIVSMRGNNRRRAQTNNTAGSALPVVKRATSMRRHVCTLCGYNTPHLYRLRAHITYKHTPLEQITWYTCNLCAYKAKVPRDLRNHCKRMHRTEGNLDELIMRDNATTSQQQQHTAAALNADHSGTEIYTTSCDAASGAIQVCYSCSQCNFTCSDGATLQSHCHFAHSAAVVRSDAAQRQRSTQADNVHTCADCSYTTRHAFSLKRHRLCYHTPSERIGWLRCSQCGYKSKFKAHLRVHGQRRHGVDVTSHMVQSMSKLVDDASPQNDPAALASATDGAGASCNAGSMPYTYNSSLGVYSCSLCAYASPRHGCVKRHVQSQHALAPLQCDYDGAQRQPPQPEHPVASTGIAPDVQQHACGQCSRHFATRHQLAAHARAHLRTDAHTCPMCGRGFSLKANMMRHYQAHQKLWPSGSHANAPPSTQQANVPMIVDGSRSNQQAANDGTLIANCVVKDEGASKI